MEFCLIDWCLYRWGCAAGVLLCALPHLHLEGARGGQLLGRGRHDAGMDPVLAAAVPYLCGTAAHSLTDERGGNKRGGRTQRLDRAAEATGDDAGGVHR